MGQAGKDGESLGPTAQSDSVPMRALASVAPQSVQLAKDNALLASSVWCGMVFSLALVITVLNVVPPVPVGYRVSTQVLASAQRLETLKQQLASHRAAATVDMALETQLLAVEVLDAQSHSVSARLEPEKEPLTLVEVRSLWPSRTTTGRVRRWLSELTKADEPQVRQIDSASAERFARWEVAARQHYLKHFRHSHVSDADGSLAGVGTLASTGDKSPTRFASLSLPSAEKAENSSGSEAANASADPSDIEASLIRELELASAREASAAASLQTQAAKIGGVLTLSGSPRVRAYPGRVPTAMVMSVLVLALAGGAIGGWSHHRAQSGGTFYAADVASSMHLAGLPVLGYVRLHGTVHATGDTRLRRRISSTRRWVVQQWLTASELVVLFWCLAIAIRMVLDPLWRAMLWDNPLAALGRLFVGLP